MLINRLRAELNNMIGEEGSISELMHNVQDRYDTDNSWGEDIGAFVEGELSWSWELRDLEDTLINIQVEVSEEDRKLIDDIDNDRVVPDYENYGLHEIFKEIQAKIIVAEILWQ